MPAPLDLHAHVDPKIEGADLRALGAFVFAVTRSLEEFTSVSQRRDGRVVWAVGVHPGLVGAQENFDRDRFRKLVEVTPIVGEIGLDGTSRVPMATQINTFRSILEVLQESPRILSIHSAGAHLQLLRELHRTPVDGVVLHWWTGSPALTEEAVRLGCYFSLPPALMSSGLLGLIPRDRILSETDHPYGDRRTPGQRTPGGVSEVEVRVGKTLDASKLEARRLIWINFRKLVEEVGVQGLLPPPWLEVLEHLD
ncbi:MULTISPECIES: TatD family hydrolase [unclassified Frondihabitans]|uniref:TatD family hydrolase n=1 Tax=unclassified Frondihabitans TaxID=2626248 RepID=UPI0018F78798|nr:MULTISPECIES: TatD family hydrolase [unclassified Frondihabitans]